MKCQRLVLLNICLFVVKSHCTPMDRGESGGIIDSNYTTTPHLESTSKLQTNKSYITKDQRNKKKKEIFDNIDSYFVSEYHNRPHNDILASSSTRKNRTDINQTISKLLDQFYEPLTDEEHIGRKSMVKGLTYLKLFLEKAKKRRKRRQTDASDVDMAEALTTSGLQLHSFNLKMMSENLEEDAAVEREVVGGGSGEMEPRDSGSSPSFPTFGIFNFLTFLVYGFSVLMTLLSLATGTLANNLSGTFLSNVLGVIINNNNNNTNDNNNENTNTNMKREIRQDDLWITLEDEQFEKLAKLLKDDLNDLKDIQNINLPTFINIFESFIENHGDLLTYLYKLWNSDDKNQRFLNISSVKKLLDKYNNSSEINDNLLINFSGNFKTNFKSVLTTLSKILLNIAFGNNNSHNIGFCFP